MGEKNQWKYVPNIAGVGGTYIKRLFIVCLNSSLIGLSIVYLATLSGSLPGRPPWKWATKPDVLQLLRSRPRAWGSAQGNEGREQNTGVWLSLLLPVLPWTFCFLHLISSFPLLQIFLKLHNLVSLPAWVCSKHPNFTDYYPAVDLEILLGCQQLNTL